MAGHASCSWLTSALLSVAALVVPASAQERVAPSRAELYSSVLEECGRKAMSGVHFFNAFGGQWPVPSNFVLLDATDRRLEYSDRAFPWDDVRTPSTIFFGPRQRLEESWPSLFSQRVQPQPGQSGVEVRKYAASAEFGQPVVVVSNRHDHMILIGPIGQALSSAMECFALTRRQVGYPC